MSLQVYSGFRYQADLTASPARWDDARQALDFADEQWSQISGKVADEALGSDMSLALTGLREAAAGKDASPAKSISTKELDLVDDLEKHFTANGRD